MSDAPYLGRTLEDALNRADQDKIDLPLVAQVYPADYDRIILAEYIRIPKQSAHHMCVWVMLGIL